MSVQRRNINTTGIDKYESISTQNLYLEYSLSRVMTSIHLHLKTATIVDRKSLIKFNTVYDFINIF